MKTGMKMHQQKKLFLQLMMITLTVLVGGFMFFNFGPQIVEGYETSNAMDPYPGHFDKLLAFLKETNPVWTTYSYDQLKQWYHNQTPGHLKFDEFLREIEGADEKCYNFNQTKYSMANNNTDWIKEITVSRINTPEMDMVNLNQWLHNSSTTNSSLTVLDTQSIVDDELFSEPSPEMYSHFSCPDDTDTDSKEVTQEVETETSKCCPCTVHPPPLPHSDLGFPENKPDSSLADKIVSMDKHTLDLEPNEADKIVARNRIVKAQRIKDHGLQAMLAFLVFIPISNFMARFYKELCGHFCPNCDKGPWIYVHVGTHVTSIVLMWISVVPALPRLSEIESQAYQCTSMFPDNVDHYQECVFNTIFQSPHMNLALPAFIFQHVLIATGVWRPRSTTMRRIQLALHSHLGYACWVLGAVSAIIASAHKRSSDNLVFSALTFIIPFIFSAVAVSLECMGERRIGLIPPRRDWSVLGPVKLNGRGPLTLAKWIVFGIFTAIMVFCWLMVFGSRYDIVIQFRNSVYKLFTEGNFMSRMTAYYISKL